MDRLIGTPWRIMSCIGLINARYNHMPNMNGGKWGRILWLPTVQYPRPGDLILWWTSETWLKDPLANDRSPSGIVPCHIEILLSPEERTILHSSAWNGDHSPGWEDRARVFLATHYPLRSGYHNLFRQEIRRPYPRRDFSGD